MPLNKETKQTKGISLVQNANSGNRVDGNDIDNDR